MAYERNKDAYQSATNISSGRDAELITPADSDLSTYPKALRIYAAAEAVVRVTPVDMVGDSNYVDLTFPAGLSIESMVVRRVWATGTDAADVIVHGYTK